MTDLIRWNQLHDWVPGKILLASDHLAWNGVSMRSYRYKAQDVVIPPMQDFMIISFDRGLTPIHRRFEGRWSHERCVPGDVSLLSRSEKSHWRWTQPVDVIHVYLTKELLTKVAAEVFDRDVEDVRLLDILKADDSLMNCSARAIAQEAASEGLGGQLYVEAIASQMSVHILRNYSTIAFRKPHVVQGLSPQQARLIVEYIDAHLDLSLTLDELAAVVHVSTWHFLRQFRLRFGSAPHAYVIAKRIERARHLLLRGVLPIKEISSCCGFSDQAHMTRLFRRHLGTTPAVVRSCAR